MLANVDFRIGVLPVGVALTRASNATRGLLGVFAGC
jgi:hypothetical protein